MSDMNMEEIHVKVNGSTLENHQREKSPIDVSESTDPLMVNAKHLSAGIQGNDQDRSQNSSRKDSLTETTGAPVADQCLKPRPRSFSQTYDGVFSNLAAKPEVMVLPKGDPLLADPPPPYHDTRADGRPRFMTLDERNLADTVDEVFLDDHEVGSVPAFVLCVLIVLVFQVYGFILAFVISQSHATRLGSIGGLGLLLAFGSFSLQSEMKDLLPPGSGEYVPIISLFIGMIGYMIFIYSITAYQKIRRIADSMINFPSSMMPGSMVNV